MLNRLLSARARSQAVRSCLAPLVTVALLLSASHSPAWAAPEAAAVKEIRLGFGLKDDSNQGRGVRFFAEEVKRLSGGKLVIKPSGASALGSDVKMQEALVAGTQEMMVGSTATLVSIAPEMALWDAPFLFQDEREADLLLEGKIGRRVLAALPARGLVGLAYWENGFRNLTNNKRPVNRLEDLADIRLRVMQNPVYIEAFQSLGATTVPLAFSELFAALKQGSVEGQENPYTTILNSKLYEVQKYLTISNHVYSPWILLASGKWWNTLSSGDKSVLQDAARLSRAYELSVTRGEAIMALAQLSKNGMQVNKISGRERERMQQKTQGAVDKIVTAVGRDLWDAAQTELRIYRTPFAQPGGAQRAALNTPPSPSGAVAQVNVIK